MPPGVWDDDYQRRGRLYRGEVRLPTVPPGARVIDLGCGDGRALYALTGRCSSAVGVDSARSALALCRESRQFPPLDLVLADVGCLPFRDRSFDLVLLFHVIGHGYQVERSSIASEVVRMCAPGGQIHLRVFSKEDFRATKGDLVEDGTRLRKNGLLTHYFYGGRGCLTLSWYDAVESRNSPVVAQNSRRVSHAGGDPGGLPASF